MKRGRPAYSIIRANIKRLLAKEEPQYGYTLFKTYCKRFAPVSLRSVYYHLHKGVERGEFIVMKATRARGEFSWGRMSERTFYGIKKGKKRANKTYKSEDKHS